MSDVEIETSNAVDFAATGDLSEEERPLLHERIRGCAQFVASRFPSPFTTPDWSRFTRRKRFGEKPVSLRALACEFAASAFRFEAGMGLRLALLNAREMIFVTLGLGQLLVMGRDLNDINEVVAVMLLIVAIGFLTDAAFFRILERSIQRKWGLAPAS